MKTLSSRIILATLGLSACSAVAVKAQDSVEASVGAYVVSTYIWRGQNLGDFSVQPSVGVSYKGLSLSAWGSFGLNGPTSDGRNLNEIDFTLSYSPCEFLTIAITDYWMGDNDTKYFGYESHTTPHVYEGTAAFDFGILSLSWNTNFAGADYFCEDGKRSYSSYAEIAIPFTISGVDFTAEVGGTPWEGAYHEKAAITNISLGASKELKITDSYSLPVFAKITANPATEKMYFAVGLSF